MQQLISFHDDGKGFPILWIHGFPLSSAVFAPQTRIAGYRHIRPDLRGFGSTPAGGPATMASYSADLLAVLDHLAIDRAVVAGVSMGGYIAMQILRDAPQRVAALLLLDTRETPDTEEGRAARYKSAEEVEKTGDTKSVLDAMTPKMVVREALRPVVRHIMQSATPAGVIAALRAMAERPDSTVTLRDASVPALVIVGEKDVITPVTDAERMVSLMKQAELAPIANAGHLANFEAPAQVNDLVPAFLARYLDQDTTTKRRKRR